MTSTQEKLLELVKDVLCEEDGELLSIGDHIWELVRNARKDGVHIDNGNIVDLAADNMPLSLDRIRLAIGVHPVLSKEFPIAAKGPAYITRQLINNIDKWAGNPFPN